MSTHHIQYIAPHEHVAPGTLLQADDGFTCLTEGQIVAVEQADDGLFVPCSEGRHYLVGQANEHGHYVGFLIVTNSEAKG